MRYTYFLFAVLVLSIITVAPADVNAGSLPPQETYVAPLQNETTTETGTSTAESKVEATIGETLSEISGTVAEAAAGDPLTVVIFLLGGILMLAAVPLTMIGIFILVRRADRYFRRRYGRFEEHDPRGKTFEKFRLYFDYSEMVSFLTRHSSHVMILGIVTLILSLFLIVTESGLVIGILSLLVSLVLLENAYYIRRFSQHKEQTTEDFDNYLEKEFY